LFVGQEPRTPAELGRGNDRTTVEYSRVGVAKVSSEREPPQETVGVCGTACGQHELLGISLTITILVLNLIVKARYAHDGLKDLWDDLVCKIVIVVRAKREPRSEAQVFPQLDHNWDPHHEPSLTG